MEAPDPLDVDTWSCPLPLRDLDRVVLGHGGGGVLSAELVEHLFLPALGADAEAELLGDAAVLEVGRSRLAFSTDSYVVRPLFFPGGSIGELAVNGTVNDIAMRGGVALALSTAFILEEGLAIEELADVTQRMGRAAERAGVRLVTGDTKVVERGHGDGLYINTAGFGVVPEGVDIRPERARPGDLVILSGSIGRHGIAVLSVREGFEFGVEVVSDTAPLSGLVQAMAGVAPDAVHVLRDPTRGGLAASLCELAVAGGVGIVIEERAVPVPAEVDAACTMLGLDPMQIANEGCLVAMVAPEASDAVLAAMRDDPNGRDATVIGRVVEDHQGTVVASTPLGATRVVDRALAEQLPRIC